MSSDEDLTPKTETQLIAAIYERAQARKRERVAGAPEVGIFWVVDGKAVILGEPLSEAESWGEFKNYSQGHDREWSRFLQRNGIVPRDSEYDDYPRGRVVYNTITGSFNLFADKCILKDKSMVQKVLAELHLPSQTTTESDPHYKCQKCGG
jgi:hypothetical protein